MFFLSEGERTFSVDNANAFALLVVHGIDVAAGTHTGLFWREGALAGDDLEFRPRVWQVAVR